MARQFTGGESRKAGQSDVGTTEHLLATRMSSAVPNGTRFWEPPLPPLKWRATFMASCRAAECKLADLSANDLTIPTFGHHRFARWSAAFTRPNVGHPTTSIALQSRAAQKRAASGAKSQRG